MVKIRTRIKDKTFDLELEVHNRLCELESENEWLKQRADILSRKMSEILESREHNGPI